MANDSSWPPPWNDPYKPDAKVEARIKSLDRPMSAEAYARELEEQTFNDFHAKQAKAEGKPPPHSGMNGNTKTEPILLFETIRASSFAGLVIPKVEFLDGRKWLPIGHASLLTGATKVGKTYVALQAAVACVTGTKWLNESIRLGPVLFYSAEENKDVIHARLADICEGENLSLSQLGDIHIIDLSEIINAALIQGDNRKESIAVTELYNRLDATMTKWKPVCLFIDNKGLAVTGSEISRPMAAAAARVFQMLAQKHHCAIIMLMHPSNTGMSNGTGASGSTANFAGYRSVIHMKIPEEATKGVRVLENDLTNYAEGGTTANLRWEMGRYICTDQPVRAGDDIGQYDKAERVFLKLLRWHVERDMKVTKASAAKEFDKLPVDQREGLNMKWLERAMLSLLDKKAIRVIPGHKNGHKTELLGMA